MDTKTGQCGHTDSATDHIVLTLVTMVGQPVIELKSNTVALRLLTPMIIMLIKVRHCLTDFPFNKVYTTIFTVPAQTHSLYNIIIIQWYTLLVKG